MDGGQQLGRRLSFLDCGATKEKEEEGEGDSDYARDRMTEESKIDFRQEEETFLENIKTGSEGWKFFPYK